MKRITTPCIGIFILVWHLLIAIGPVSADSPLLPGVLISLPESEHAVIVEKKTQSLYLYASNQDQVDLVFKVPCSTGEVAGSKTKAGDKKTPEGVYFLKDEYEDRYLTAVYGKKAFPSDYPNFMDLRLGKQGSAIWIHGTDKKLKPMDSNGCIALDNENVLALSGYVRLDATPLIIVESLTFRPAAVVAEEKRQISAFIEGWVQALEKGSYHKYLSFYDETYLPQISWWETWIGLRKAAGASGNDRLEVKLDNMGIYDQNGVVVVLADMTLTVGNDSRYLGKRQFFIRNHKGHPVIVGDLFQKKAGTYGAGEAVLTAAAGEMVRDGSTDEKVVETVEQWLAAWSAKDMAEYAAFYANDFYSDGLGKNAWVRKKKRLAKQYDYISVTGKDYKVVQKKDGYVVSFLQNYKSSGYSAQGRKQLKLVKKGGVWKIYRENWKGK